MVHFLPQYGFNFPHPWLDIDPNIRRWLPAINSPVCAGARLFSPSPLIALQFNLQFIPLTLSILISPKPCRLLNAKINISATQGFMLLCPEDQDDEKQEVSFSPTNFSLSLPSLPSPPPPPRVQASAREQSARVFSARVPKRCPAPSRFFLLSA